MITSTHTVQTHNPGSCCWQFVASYNVFISKATELNVSKDKPRLLLSRSYRGTWSLTRAISIIRWGNIIWGLPNPPKKKTIYNAKLLFFLFFNCKWKYRNDFLRLQYKLIRYWNKGVHIVFVCCKQYKSASW